MRLALLFLTLLIAIPSAQAAEGELPPTRVSIDQDNDRIEFYIKGKRVGYFNEHGLVVDGPLSGTAFDAIPETKITTDEDDSSCSDCAADEIKEERDE